MSASPPRELRILVDAGELTCGPCHRRSSPTKAGGPSFCGVFGVALTKAAAGDNQRLTGCLAAEQASRPWVGVDDDDGFPMHLATTEASK